MMEGMLNAKGEEQLIEVLKGFEEDQIDAAVEESAHLRAKTFLPVDALFLRSQTDPMGRRCRLRRPLWPLASQAALPASLFH